MEQLLGFAFPGVPYGCSYAIVAVSLVLTYQATGVFNFAFGAQAYASAFVFTLLTQNEGWSGFPAFLISVVVMGPLVGLAFDRLLFRHIPNANSTAKLVCSLSLLVGIPDLMPVIFGPQNLDTTATIFPFFNPNVVYFTLAGTPFNGVYLSTISVTVVVLVALTLLLRFTNLGLQMRGAVESRRLVQLDGVNGDGVVMIAWMVSSFMAGLAGVLLAPVFGAFTSDNFASLTVVAIAGAACALMKNLPIAAGVAVLIGVATTVLQGYIPPNGIINAAVVPALPFLVIVLALIFLPGMRSLDSSRDPLSTVDPPPPPIAAVARAPQMDRIIRRAWWVLLAAFVVSMLTWMPITWAGVFNHGLALSVVLLSVSLITGMAGQLSLSQGTFAGIGAFASVQLANHLGLNMLVGGLVGAALAACVAVILAVLSLRLRGLGLALMTLAAALLFDATFFNAISISGGSAGITLKSQWLGTTAFFNFNGHAFFLLVIAVLTLCVFLVMLVRKGTVGRNLAAMRGSETAAAGLGINLTRQRIMIFALSGAMAGLGGVLISIQQQQAAPNDWNYEFSLVFVVLVVTTSVSTVEGAIQAGIGFVVTEQLLTYLPARFGGPSLTIVLFAFGALTYASHPEGVLEYQKRRSTLRFERFFAKDTPTLTPATTNG
ncbi:MAG TPA: ABC transporter permease [Acidimicrobiales bacterium]|jgi:branched-subunit amino acid ABC-type transport system permease component|nr:ABC transporter permease [Acidimicrobiales bacterium]